MKFRTVIKDIAIILFVALAVGVAGILFYRYVLKRDANKVQVVSMGVEKKDDDMLTKIATINAIMNSDGTDSRLNDISKTIAHLNNSLVFLGQYYTVDPVIDDATLKSYQNKMEKSKSLFNDMHDEYVEKSKDTTYFPRHTGANDIVSTLSNYIENYSKFLLRLNNRISNYNVEREADINFSLIDLYASVSLQTYSDLNELNYTSKLAPNNIDNIRYCNEKINIKANGVTGLNLSEFSRQANLFGRYYFASDTKNIATNLVNILDEVTAETSAESNENMVGYLLIQLLGR